MRTATTLIAVCLAAVACQRAAPPPQPAAAPTISPTKFEKLYRASKTMQAAIATGVTVAKFNELLQGFGTEIAIVKDHQPNAPEQRLLDLYEEAYGHYKISAVFWQMKVMASDAMWRGEIPIDFKGKQASPVVIEATSAYKLPIANRKFPYGVEYRSVQGDAVQVIWQRADGAIDAASKAYLASEQR